MYLYVDSMFGETGKATLQSQMFVPQEDNDLCFHFWFYGNDVKLAVELEAEGFSRKEVWQQGDGGGQWEEGQVHVKAKEFFSDKAYQVHAILSFCSLTTCCVSECRCEKYVRIVLVNFIIIITIAKKLSLIQVGIENKAFKFSISVVQ
ncbi:hypothetical protein E2C01_084662 [Portunus trituberculatus]|uniref:MAM domain-containing protein n=1 Tax=Portunus trituberculatus TaxID=210409 RepID=A0A5B7J4L6_PORTR|nr:hypothetical protein [Portunus trituberculatus]